MNVKRYLEFEFRSARHQVSATFLSRLPPPNPPIAPRCAVIRLMQIGRPSEYQILGVKTADYLSHDFSRSGFWAAPRLLGEGDDDREGEYSGTVASH